MDSKQLLKWGMIAVAAYFVYDWLSANGFLGTPAVAAALPAALEPASVPVSTSLPASTSPAASLPGPFQQAIQAMQAAAGNDLQSLDVWSYYWQNGTPFAGSPLGYGVSGSVTPAQMAQITNFNGGTNPTSAEQFVAWLNETPYTAPTYGGTGPGMQGVVNPGLRWVM